MKYKVDVEKTLTEFWVIRGVKACESGKKTVLKEEEHDKPPSMNEIAQFLNNNPDCKFCSVEHNFKLE